MTMEIKLKDEDNTIITNEMIIEIGISGQLMDLSDSEGCFKIFNGFIAINEGFTDMHGRSTSIMLRYENYNDMFSDYEKLHEESMF